MNVAAGDADSAASTQPCLHAEAAVQHGPEAGLPSRASNRQPFLLTPTGMGASCR